MKIALLGYGKMGQIIERIAIERGHEIVLRKKSTDNYDGLKDADVAIDFSVPSAAVQNISTCFELGVPVISGTTGWLEEYDNMVALCTKNNGAFLYGSNFSLGVNLFFELNSYLAKMMSNLQDYKVSMEEIHHTQKLDAPSGTAITLANGIIDNSAYTEWTLDNAQNNQIHIDAKRVDSVPGTHSVFYDSAIDQIEIKHTAHNREGFALGAVVAAEWIQNKKGIFSMKDVLNLKK
ncbi:4-hydroxy-tetrahydrodipicolinate reductase [Myroides marinus]|uniref:4-hydroxy-tetrahydrodipicolinate reductase n=1 Tax=Myroides marinus TaxID=703342 RepID=A0A165QTW5_9FLAO|nr:4-hydroxy-tetrahydrodipicolinate reductase [Myroides marinus]KZE76574.1 4-hydroxy-tetrahydrodipicolinate reductase [Myroides marinus]MDM1345822.1 4-hydroxy-tetrahydrodipicolinate reductase [Myroides marinus]MDM1349317.1 4-hydroxy-tetrahydrodipicolinate reductase [Myroides marinus]MDM1353005.1 4-hydroxy-tetrahydrodipicolinate reductase [Myroides marinus]MDM1356527.1 4-hydroxy-tetrahydrodipicolinate reductase [Myroides marinus]